MSFLIPMLKRSVPALFIVCLWPAWSAVDYSVEESPQQVLIKTPRYEAALTRDGVGMTIRRNGGVLLEFPAVSPMPAGPGGRRSPSKMRSFSNSGAVVTLEYNGARTELRPQEDFIRVSTWFYREGPNTTPALKWRMEPAGVWWGGGFQGLSSPHVLPLNLAKFRTESFAATASTQGTPLWFSTSGVAVWLRTMADFRYAVNEGADEGLIAIEVPRATSITYDVYLAENGREAVRRVLREIGYPHSVPPAEYMRLPVYTTWVENKGGINQQKVIDFARRIHDSKLPCGVIEIDIGWETKFGDLEVDLKKFPDMKAMTDELRKMGMSVTLWVANFVNTDSKTFAEHRDDGWLVRDASGNTGLIGWWSGYGGVWDYTNPQAAEEFRARLTRLMRLYGVAGFKFDSGEANLVPRDLRTYIPIALLEYADYFNREAVAYFPWNESRVGVLSAPAGTVQRLQDKQTSWDNRNGLAAMISQALTVSLRGFFYVMPDIVGGNEYGRDPLTKELLVRWAQASALMPLIQFSKGPWHFDEEAMRIVRETSQLHVDFSPYIYRLGDQARLSGEPIIAPLWYHAPAEAETFSITDQFMLGPDVVVAPVLVKDARARDIYLPAGEWTDFKSGAAFKGGAWLRNYSAPLDTLPIFVRKGFRLPK